MCAPGGDPGSPGIWAPSADVGLFAADTTVFFLYLRHPPERLPSLLGSSPALGNELIGLILRSFTMQVFTPRVRSRDTLPVTNEPNASIAINDALPAGF